MTMKDWVEELNYFLKMNRKEILNDSGKVSHKQAIEKAEIEYALKNNKKVNYLVKK